MNDRDEAGRARDSMVGGRANSHAQTLPPTDGAALSAAAGATILVLSHDAGLASAVKEASAGRFAVRVINEWDDLLVLLAGPAGRILLLDTDALPAAVEEALAELFGLHDWFVVVLAARQQQAEALMPLCSNGRVHRLLVKPATADFASIILQSAVSRFLEISEMNERTDELKILDVPVYEPPQRDHRLVILLAVVAVGLCLAGLGLFLA